MPIQKLQFKPGILRDQTALAAEGGWYACDKVRFRMGYPEKIGGWLRISDEVYKGTARTLSAWRALAGFPLVGVGTNLKMYVESGGVYNDITPIRTTRTLAANAFTTANGSAVVVVNDTAHGADDGDFVTLSGALTTVGGISAMQLTGEFQITFLTLNTYSIVTTGLASSAATGGNTDLVYQLHIGAASNAVAYGWGAGAWGSNAYGQPTGSVLLRLWSQVPYGELLLFGQLGGAPYVFKPEATGTVFNRGTLLSAEPGANAVPVVQNYMFFSSAARILVMLGTTPFVGGAMDPLLVRWSSASDIVDWEPRIDNQAGEYRLLRGSIIVAHQSSRQDELILTDTAAYVMQYVGPPYVFSFSQVADNISIMGPNAITAANGVVYWMGADKFYMFDGSVRTLPCPLKKDVFGDLNYFESVQCFAGTSEGFDEVWFFYCSTAQTSNDKYVVFNYVDSTWHYGSMTRTAWLDTPLQEGPLAATAINNLVTHEVGVDDNSTAAPTPITSFVQSADFDIGDGQSYAFVNKMLPDVSFVASTSGTPTVYFTLNGKRDPGSPERTTPAQPVRQGIPVTEWTPEIYVRLRGRQMNFVLTCVDAGTQWQLGTPRLNVRPDGRSA